MAWFFKKKDKEKKDKQTLLLKNTLIEQILSLESPMQLSTKDITKITQDLVVSQCLLSRKAPVLKKKAIINAKEEKHKEILQKVFHDSILSQILDTHLYGLNPFEINWELENGIFIPKLINRDYRDFEYNAEGKLEFIGNGFKQEIPDKKLVYGIFNQSWRNLYGESSLKKLYFSIKIKNAGMEFWIRFLERFGDPWAIGKTDDDPQSLAYELYNMLNGSSAVISKDEEISLVQPSSNVSFKEIVEFCDSQIRSFLLGANLSGYVSGGSYAATNTHNAIREEIALSDERILLYLCNKTIAYFCELNGITDAISLSLFDEGNPKNDLSLRDKTIFEMGYQPTKEYIEKTYNIEVEQKESVHFANSTLNPYLIPFKKPLKEGIKDNPAFKDNIEQFIEGLEFQDFDILKIIKGAKNFEEAMEKIQNAANGEQLEFLEEQFARAIANAKIYGALNA
ncbi:phage portal protein family protein [Helicobacter pullorum]